MFRRCSVFGWRTRSSSVFGWRARSSSVFNGWTRSALVRRDRAAFLRRPASVLRRRGSLSWRPRRLSGRFRRSGCVLCCAGGRDVSAVLGCGVVRSAGGCGTDAVLGCGVVCPSGGRGTIGAQRVARALLAVVGRAVLALVGRVAFVCRHWTRCRNIHRTILRSHHACSLERAGLGSCRDWRTAMVLRS